METTCSIDGCTTPPRTRGMCGKHYARLLRHGDPSIVKPRTAGPRKIAPAIERFTSRYEVDAAGCWIWTAGTSDGGYGRFNPSHDEHWAAHRWSYTHFIGPIPDGFTIDHLCRVRLCVNPDHLEAVTLRENLLRGDTLPARLAAQTHCKRGHEFTPENTYVYRGSRICRKCHAAKTARQRAARRQ